MFVIENKTTKIENKKNIKNFYKKEVKIWLLSQLSFVVVICYVFYLYTWGITFENAVKVETNCLTRKIIRELYLGSHIREKHNINPKLVFPFQICRWRCMFRKYNIRTKKSILRIKPRNQNQKFRWWFSLRITIVGYNHRNFSNPVSPYFFYTCIKLLTFEISSNIIREMIIYKL